MKNRGFSIVEVMFAIMILGIGFIMVAAMFPVAVQQTQANVDESTGRAVAMTGAMETTNALRLAVTPTDQATLNTGTEYFRVQKIPNTSALPIRDQINSSTMYQADARFAWTSFLQYNYSATNKSYSLITVALRARNIPEQTSLDQAIGYSGYPSATWQTGTSAYDNAVVTCKANLIKVAGTPGRILINTGGGDPNPVQAPDAAVEGGILIIRTHTEIGAIGRIYYLSAYDTSTGQWELDPKSDAFPTSSLSGVDCFLLGRGLRTPNSAWDSTNNPREGLSQVVGIYRMTSALP